MKHVKAFESLTEKEQEKVDLLADLMSRNPKSEDNDFYIFLAKDTFKETKGGLYKKELEIENMIRITPDYHGLFSIHGLEMREKFQIDSKIYHIWLPKEMRTDIEGKSDGDMKPWLLKMINKNKSYGADEYGKKVYKDAIDMRKNASKFNI